MSRFFQRKPDQKKAQPHAGQRQGSLSGFEDELPDEYDDAPIDLGPARSQGGAATGRTNGTPSATWQDPLAAPRASRTSALSHSDSGGHERDRHSQSQPPQHRPVPNRNTPDARYPGFADQDYGAHVFDDRDGPLDRDAPYDLREPAPFDDGEYAGGYASEHDDSYLSDLPSGPDWLTVREVEKSFKKRTVVRGVSLAVRRGEAVGLLGPNGAGKTTCFYMVTGLIPADAGQILIDGNDVTSLPMYRRARLGIGYLPQEQSIFRGLTVEQNILAVLELFEPNRKRRREQLDALLDEFDITRLRKSPSIALSGGERRRCEIARALASRPSYILLDEPFAGVDPVAVGEIKDLVRQLTSQNIGVLITDHNVRETLDLVDRAYIVYDGQVLAQGLPEDIKSNERVREVYLGNTFAG